MTVMDTTQRKPIPQAHQGKLPDWYTRGPYRKIEQGDDSRRWINALTSYDLDLLWNEYIVHEAGVQGRLHGQDRPDDVTIYFIRADVGGPVKIGRATNLAVRLRTLQMACPMTLVVVASLQGQPTIERDYHRQFKEHRLHGEWFNPHPDILAEIERLKEAA